MREPLAGMTPLLVEGMRGLGDNIYQRPFVRALAQRREVYLSTPWPELYADLPVRFVRTRTTLRTQAINESRQSAETWTAPPAKAERVRVTYGSALSTTNIPSAMERAMPLSGAPFIFDLPPMGPAPFVGDDRPYAVIRPVTVRGEWRNEARNPLPEYISEIADELRQTHRVVLLAHLERGHEWLVGDIPPHDEAYLRGELSIREALALIREADVVVGGVGWIVPAAIALKRPAFFVLGGQGGHNAPERITDPRMDLSRIGWARPTPYCACQSMRHACPKRIPDLMRHWRRWRANRWIYSPG